MIACCSSADLSARLMEEAIRSARKDPSLSITTPSRTSLIGTNSCVACALTLVLVGIGVLNFKPGTLIALYSHGGPIFNIKRPREVFEPAFRKFWHHTSG